MTIRQLGEKYGGIIAEFVLRCDEEGLDCETEKIDSEMFNTLISSLRNDKPINKMVVMYSGSEKLYKEWKNKRVIDFFDAVNDENLDKIQSIWDDCLESKMENWLYIVFEKNNSKLIEWFLEKCVEFDAEDELLDIITDNIPSLKVHLTLLSKCRTYALTIDDNKLEIFTNACLSGDIDLARYIQDNHKIQLYDLTELLIDICKEGHLKLAEWIFDNYNEPNNFNFREILLYFQEICKSGNLKMAQWLYAKFPGMNLHDGYGATFYAYASEGGNLKLIQWLLSICPDIIDNDKFRFAFHSSCKKGHLKLAKWFLKIKPEIEVLSDSFYLSQICRNGHVDVIKWLFKVKPNLFSSEHKKQVYYIACQEGLNDLARWAISDD